MLEAKAGLLVLLEADYRPKKERGQALGSGNTIADLLFTMRRTKEAEKRKQTPEYQKLGNYIEGLLLQAQITQSFRAVLQERLQAPYAQQSKVADFINPSDLGFEEDGLGILDPVSTPVVEGRFLRKHLLTTLNRCVLSTDTGQGIKYIVVEQEVYNNAIERINSWRGEYSKFYGTDPFEGKPIELSWASRRIDSFGPFFEAGQ